MKNDWEKKATCSAYLSTIIKQNLCHFSVRFDSSTSLSSLHPTATVQLIPYIYPAFVPFGRYFTSIPFYLWIQSKSAFFHALTVSLLTKNRMLFIVSKQCACSRRVPIEGHMNRFEYCHPDNNSDNDSFVFFFVKKSYLLQQNSVLIFILWRSVRKSTIILGMKKLRSW